MSHFKHSDWTAFRKDGQFAAEEFQCCKVQKEFHNLLSYFGRFEFLLVLQLLILQVLHFVLENPQLSDQALENRMR